MYIDFRNYQIQEKRKGKTCSVVYFQGPGGDPGMFGKLSYKHAQHSLASYMNPQLW